MIKKKRYSFIKIISNPFEVISDKTLLIIGLIAYLLSSLIVYNTNNHFQGLFMIRAGATSSLMLSLYNNAIAIFLLTLVAYGYGRWRNDNTHWIGVLNVVLISRIIIYIVMLLLLNSVLINNTIMKVEFAILDKDYWLQSLTYFDYLVLLAIGMLTLFGIVYFFYFFINGLRYTIGVKGKIEGLWILCLVFGLEIVFTLVHLNIN